MKRNEQHPIAIRLFNDRELHIVAMFVESDGEHVTHIRILVLGFDKIGLLQSRQHASSRRICRSWTLEKVTSLRLAQKETAWCCRKFLYLRKRPMRLHNISMCWTNSKVKTLAVMLENRLFTVGMESLSVGCELAVSWDGSLDPPGYAR